MNWARSILLVVGLLTLSSSVLAEQPRIGPLAVETENATFRIFALSQLRGQMRLQEGEDDYALTLHRQRIGLRFRTTDGKIGGEVEFDFSPRVMEVFDAFVDYRPLDYLAIRAGVAKTPFTLYFNGPVAGLRAVDWAPVTHYFGGERQIGVKFYHPDKKATWRYALGIYDGLAQQRGQGTKLASLYGKERLSPLSMRNPERVGAIVHPEVVGRLSWHAKIGDLKLSAAASSAADFRAVKGYDHAFRAALEFRAGWRELRLHVGSYFTMIRAVDDALKAGMWGGMVEIADSFGDFELTARYALVATTEALRRDAAKTRDDGKTPFRDLHEATLALSYDPYGPDLRLTGDISLLRSHDENSFRGRIQMQFGF